MEKRTSFKEMSTSQKMSFVWYYYKWHIIISVVVILSVLSLVNSATDYKEPDLSVIMINSESEDTSYFTNMLKSGTEDITIKMNARLSFNEDGKPVGFYMDETVLGTNLNSNMYDLFFGNGEKMLYCAEEGFFVDLRDVLPAKVYDSIPQENLLFSTVNGHSEKYPCAVRIENTDFLNTYYPDSECYCGIIYNDPHPQNASIVLEQLLK